MDERRPYHGVPFSERRKPLGLIAKYPNYEPFHPPPREDFVYPTHMHPPLPPPQSAQQRQPRRRSSSRNDLSPPRKYYRHDDDERNRYRYDDRREGRRSPSPRSPSSRIRDYERRRSPSRKYYRRSLTPSREYDYRRRSHSRGSRTPPSQRRGRSRSWSAFSTASSVENDVSQRLHTERYWERGDSDVGSEVDLSEELHQLADHVHDRETLLTQAIRSLRGKRLKAMIPPVLRNIPIVQLEQRCLRILQQLDPQTVFNILDGKMAKMVEDSTKKDKSDQEVPIEEDAPGPPKLKKRKTKKKETDNSKKIKTKKKVVKKETKKKKKKKKATEANAPKTLMELLELEYRAKAIKALLRTQGVSIDEDSETPTASAKETVHPVREEKSKAEDKENENKQSPSSMAEPDTTTKVTEEEDEEEEKELEEVSSDEEEENETIMDKVQKVLGENQTDDESTAVEDTLGDGASNCLPLLTKSYSTLEEDKLRSKLVENLARRQSIDKNDTNSPKNKSRSKFKKNKKKLDIVEEDVLELHAASSADEAEEDEDAQEEDDDYDEDSVEKRMEEEEVEDVVEDKTAWNDILAEGETLDSVSVASNGVVEEESVQNSSTISDKEERKEDDEEENQDVESNNEKQNLSEEEKEALVDNEETREEEVEHQEREETNEDDELDYSIDELPPMLSAEFSVEKVVTTEDEETRGEFVEEELVEKFPEELEEGEIDSGMSERDEDSTQFQDTSPISEGPEQYNDDSTSRRSLLCEPTDNSKYDAVISPRRPKSPVEFITSFEDTKSEDDEEEDEAGNVEQEKAPSPQVHGCENLPLGEDDNNEDSTANDNNNTNREDLPVTWYERWFNSQGMQKVVKTNKIQKKLRRKLKDAETEKKKLKDPPILDVNVAAEPIIGSIEEYEKLFGKKVGGDGDAPPNASASEATSAAPQEDEEDETDDLWEDIIDT